MSTNFGYVLLERISCIRGNLYLVCNPVTIRIVKPALSSLISRDKNYLNVNFG